MQDTNCEGLCLMQVMVLLENLLYIRPHTPIAGGRVIVEIDNSPWLNTIAFSLEE